MPDGSRDKRIQKLIQKTLLYGVVLSLFFFAAGGLFGISGFHGGSLKMLESGIVVLLFTPVARLMVMIYSFMLSREYEFSLASLVVLVLLFVSFVI
ncbi:MAG: DUF1634 domain-containing protein [Elusimicrobia bacterium]|nr:DUF1634 domain-containing protein [Elusimicrobiota bacterium]